MSQQQQQPEEEPVDPFADETPPETIEVRSGEQLDWATIEAHLRAGLPAEVVDAGPFTVNQFPNGAANLTYLIAFGETELVLRRPPFGTLAPGAHDMKREFKVLSRLWSHFDRAPRAYLFCDDHSIAGADFFVMERRQGVVVRGIVPESMRGHDRVGHRMGIALIDAIAEFHMLDAQACDLGDLGRPDGFVARQVSGWRKRWDLVADPAHDEAMVAIHQALEASTPEAQRVSLVHNDLKLDNCMFDPADPDRVIAFFDWDMTTLGDPLADFAYALNGWSDPEDEIRVSHEAATTAPGFPRRQALADHYAELTGCDISNLDYYRTFNYFKTACILHGVYARYMLGQKSTEGIDLEGLKERMIGSIDLAVAQSGR